MYQALELAFPYIIASIFVLAIIVAAGQWSRARREREIYRQTQRRR